MMSKRGKLGSGHKLLMVMLALAVGLAVIGPASAGVAQKSPAETQYTAPPPPAASPEAEPQVEPEIFLPPTVASGGQEDSAGSGGLLPFTGAALIAPSVLGGLLLAGGLLLVYRTRRREV